MSSAINAYNSASLAIDNLGYEQQVKTIELMVENADEAYRLHEDNYEKEIKRLDKVLADNEKMLEASLGIDSSVLETRLAIEQFESSLIAVTESNGLSYLEDAQLNRDAIIENDNNNAQTAKVQQQTQNHNNDTMIGELRRIRAYMASISNSTDDTARNTRSSSDDLDYIRQVGVDARITQ